MACHVGGGEAATTIRKRYQNCHQQLIVSQISQRCSLPHPVPEVLGVGTHWKTGEEKGRRQSLESRSSLQ